MPTIADQTITRGEIREFEQGDWIADVSTASGVRLPVGARVAIVAETKTWNGAIVAGDISEGVGRYRVEGRPEFGASRPARPSNAEHSAGSVLLSTVLSRILLETLGPSWKPLVVLPSFIADAKDPRSRVGADYERPGARGATVVTARDLFALLGLSWYVRNDGITVFGVRPSGPVETAERILIATRNDAIGYRVVNCEDPGAFSPGLTFDGDVIGDITFAISPKDITMHIWSRFASNTPAEWLRSTWRRLFPRAELQGHYEYVVAGPSVQGRHDLRSTGSRWLPDIKEASFWAGIGGYRAALTTGTRVGVSFLDADPAKPILVCVEPLTVDVGDLVVYNHAPDTSFHYANDSIEVRAFNTVAVDAAGVDLGRAETRVLRSGDPVAIVTWSPPAAPVPIPGVSPAFLIHMADIGAPIPTVQPSRVKA